jgi:hypothetical protein
MDTSTPMLINDLCTLRGDKTIPPRTSIKIGHAIARLAELDTENRELKSKLGLIHAEILRQMDSTHKY